MLTRPGEIPRDPHQPQGGRQPAKVRHSALAQNRASAQKSQAGTLPARGSFLPASRPLALSPHPAAYRREGAFMQHLLHASSQVISPFYQQGN